MATVFRTASGSALLRPSPVWGWTWAVAAVVLRGDGPKVQGELRRAVLVASHGFRVLRHRSGDVGDAQAADR